MNLIFECKRLVKDCYIFSNGVSAKVVNMEIGYYGRLAGRCYVVVW